MLATIQFKIFYVVCCLKAETIILTHCFCTVVKFLERIYEYIEVIEVLSKM